MLVKILIVEHHKQVREALRDWLEAKFPRSYLFEATSGEEAIALTQSEAPDLVVMDLRLPGINGLETTRKIKAILPGVQIVILATFDDKIYRAYAADAGASAYIPKQAIQTELHEVINSLLPVAQDEQILQRIG